MAAKPKPPAQSQQAASHPEEASPPAAERQPIAAVAQALAWAEAVVDVRAPVEFDKGAIAGSVNIPLFTNQERAEVGTLYKQAGREPALDRGLALVGEKLAPFVQSFEPFKSKRLLVTCARGGMRSSSVVSLLTSMGFTVRQLPGGYKAFRNHLLARLNQPPPPKLLVIHGHTGVGKTLLLHKLPNHLDLEGQAQHRSSLFGGAGRQPRTQQGFEAHLLAGLDGLDLTRPVWIEGESRKVGTVLIPERLNAAMRQAPCVLLTAPMALRVQRIIAEYDTGAPGVRAQLLAAVRSLKAPLGGEKVAQLESWFNANRLDLLVQALLEEYYDPRYSHAMRHYQYALELDATGLDEAARQLQAYVAQHEAELWG